MSLTVVYCGKVPSTQDIAWHYYNNYGIEHVGFWTDEQTQGRGRMGRKWITPPKKAIAFSISLTVKIFPSNIEHLSVNLANHIVKLLNIAFPGTKDILRVKHPNDIYLHDKKLCGILIESKLRHDIIHAITTGIGMNILSYEFPSNINATSLDKVVAHLPPLPTIADMLINATYQFFKPYLI